MDPPQGASTATPGSSASSSSAPASGITAPAPPPLNTAASSSSTPAAAPGPVSASDATPKDGASSTAAHSPTQPKALPQRDKESFRKLQISQAIAKDSVYHAAVLDCQTRIDEILRNASAKAADYGMIRGPHRASFPPSKLYGEGYSGYGNGFTDLPPNHYKIIYPGDKPRPGKRQVPMLKYSKKDMAKQAELHEELVPLRLDVEHDKVKLRDTFTWNLHERLVPAEHFAAQLIEDMGLKPPVAQHVGDQVIAQIREQLKDFYPMVFSEEDALDPELPYLAYKNDEMRILVKLNITIGQHTLVDQFEWDINNPLNSPEEFAACMSRDLSLSGEFTTAIAHCIREQTQLFVKGLYTIGHPFDGRPIEDADLVGAMLPSPLPTVFRPQQQAKEYAPYMYELSEADLERNEVIFSREQRRQKRSVNRRGGPQLPDLKERQRTIRTLIVSSVLPGAALDVESSRLYKRAAGTASGRKRPGARGDDSDSSDSDDSAPDSPAIGATQGTARTRGMRGAATAAAQRMANLGRSSETPEATTIHHHETRTSRRYNRDARDSTEEPNHLVITLKVPKDKLQMILRGAGRKKHFTPARSETPGQRAASVSVSAAMQPPLTPSASVQGQPSKSNTPAAPSQALIGRIPAAPPGPGGQFPPAPPIPKWLVEELQNLKKPGRYPNDQVEAIMRYVAIDPVKGSSTAVQAGSEANPELKYAFLPRIRCLDCTGKLYTPGPDMTLTNFEVHLKNRTHCERVAQRISGVDRPMASSHPTSTPQPTPAQAPPSEE